MTSLGDSWHRSVAGWSPLRTRSSCSMAWMIHLERNGSKVAGGFARRGPSLRSLGLPNRRRPGSQGARGPRGWIGQVRPAPAGMENVRTGSERRLMTDERLPTWREAYGPRAAATLLFSECWMHAENEQGEKGSC